MAKAFTLTLDRFGGLNLPENGEVPISDGDSPDMNNFCITPAGQLKVREGYQVLQEQTGAVRCLWQGMLEKTQYYLAVIGEVLYRSFDGYRTMEQIATVAPTGTISCLEFREKLYFLTAQGLHTFDGETYEKITPYRPLIRVASPPSGGGTPYEDPNLLTGEVRQTFSPDGASLYYYLAEAPVQSIDYVRHNGKDLVKGVDYEVYPGEGKLLIRDAAAEDFLPAGTETLEIGYTLWDYVYGDIHMCQWGVTYGGENDTRAFVYGNPHSPATRYYSGLVDGLPSMAYFPASNYSMVGDGEEITSIVRHYDRQIIFTRHATYYSYPEIQTDQNGMQYTSFPVYTLSAIRGNIIHGLNLLVDNKPLSVMPSGLYLWTNTSIRDERNAVCISQRIARALSEKDLSQARLFLRTSTQELFLVLDDGIFVYHYGENLFYRYTGFSPTAMLEDDRNRFYFGTEDGKICLFGGDTDAGEGIAAHWKSGALFCSDRTHKKNLLSVTVGLNQTNAADLTLSWESDAGCQGTFSLPLEKASPASHIQSCRCRVRAKRFSNISLSLSRNKNAGALSVTHLILRGKINDQIT